MRTSERNSRAAGLTPQRYLLLLMIKGAPDGSEQSTVTELAERLQLAQTPSPSSSAAPRRSASSSDRARATTAGLRSCD